MLVVLTYSNNTFIGLRVVNSTHNIAYFEFTDAVTDWDFSHSNFCELYDLASDPHQLRNLCQSSEIPPGLREALHEQVHARVSIILASVHAHSPLSNAM